MLDTETAQCYWNNGRDFENEENPLKWDMKTPIAIGDVPKIVQDLCEKTGHNTLKSFVEKSRGKLERVMILLNRENQTATIARGSADAPEGESRPTLYCETYRLDEINPAHLKDSIEPSIELANFLSLRTIAENVLKKK